MKIKQIILEGFKSFANKTVINLAGDFTTIVGPNGSGKSNITDAIKWVLGEQSSKNLRGKSMQDVIFAGSNSKRAMNFAEVTLVLDNSQKELDLEYEEIHLTRIIYKSGESVYKINNVKSRLKDINNLMLDSGLTASSFSMISQGKIESIFNSKPEDRKYIFEEAAGVLKYKKNKRESFLKLEKVNNNLNRLNDILHEIKSRIIPLKKQKENADKFLEIKNQLKDLEVKYLLINISKNLEKINKIKKIKEQNQEQIKTLEDNNLDIKNKINDISSKIDVIESKIKEKQRDLLLENNKIQNLETKMMINLKNLDNKEYYITRSNDLKNNLNIKNQEIEIKDQEINDKNNQIKEIKNKLEKSLSRKSILDDEIKDLLEKVQIQKTKLANLENKLLFLQSSKENLNNVNIGTKNIILNKEKLSGVVDSLFNLIKTKPKYSLAIETALGPYLQYIITNDEDSAKKAINYLKNNKLGKATFIPKDKVKKFNIDLNDFKVITRMDGFEGFATDFIKTSLNKELINSLLKNTIIARDLDSAIKIKNELNKPTKIVSLDGEVIQSSGYMSGGVYKNQNQSLINLDFEIENLNNQIIELKNELAINSSQIDELNISKNSLNEQTNEFNIKIYSYQREINLLNDIKNNLKKEVDIFNEEINQIETLLNNNLQSKDSSKNNEVLKLKMRYQVKEEQISELRENIKENKDLILNYQNTLDNNSQQINNLNKQIMQNELEISKLEFTNSNNFKILNEEYQVIYKNENIYDENFDLKAAKEKIKKFKQDLKNIGDVNLSAIADFDNLNKRYTFLEEQRKDIIKSKENIIASVASMDEEMKSKFKNAFDKINEEFKLTFKELFKGGNAELKLTDPKNLLETGVEIIAQPPGKKLSKVSLMSGGEKSLTTISLLFAILKIKKVPFVILDEAEAALDEANVFRYSSYLNNYKSESQFLVITHRKGTMENSNYLYGVTMQEKGISKIVSVKLN